MSCRSHTRRGGFTLVELLVVIAIIGVLVGLLLPAVQAAREAARRMSCSNNLKQLGLAAHNYNDTFGTFPRNNAPGNGDVAAKRNPRTQWMQFSWLTKVLPFMEQQPLYDQITWNTHNSMNQPENNPLAQSIISGFICPSNAQESLRNGQVPGYRWEGTSTAAGTDYVGNMGHIWGGWKDCGAVPDFPGPPSRPLLFDKNANQGTPWVNGESLGEQRNINGVFKYFGEIKMAQVRDGLSNTLLVFEDMHWRGGNNPAFHDKQHTDDAAWMSALAAINTVRNPINNTNPAWLQGAGDRRCHGWSSEHPAGAQAALCDGSVRFVSETIDNVVRYAAGVRDDGLTVQLE